VAVVAFHQRDGRAIRMRTYVPVEDLEQRRGRFRRGLGGVAGELDDLRGERVALRAREQRAQHVARRLDLRQGVVGYAHPELLLDPQPQLVAAEAVEPQVALEQAVQRRGDDRAGGAPRLGQEGVQDVEQRPSGLLRRERGLGRRGDGHAWWEWNAAVIVIRLPAARVLPCPGGP
jgi:hypothetical protein